MLTAWMWANRIRVHSKERDRNESPVASETKHCVAQLEGSVVLVRVPLVKIDVCA